MAREYYNSRYFYVQKRMQEENDEGGLSLSTNKYARQVAYGHEYDSKVGNGEDMREYQNLAMEHDARWEYIKDDLIDALGAYRCMSYRALSKHVNYWCSKATIERWSKSHETYHFYTKKIKPGVAEDNKRKQVVFSEFVHRRWYLILEGGSSSSVDHNKHNWKQSFSLLYTLPITLRSQNTLGLKRREMVEWISATLQCKDL